MSLSTLSLYSQIQVAFHISSLLFSVNVVRLGVFLLQTSPLPVTTLQEKTFPA